MAVARTVREVKGSTDSTGKLYTGTKKTLRYMDEKSKKLTVAKPKNSTSEMPKAMADAKMKKENNKHPSRAKNAAVDYSPEKEYNIKLRIVKWEDES